ncbi:helix-turn-helix domain-containing protein [Nitrospira sp. Kam-Ns4a]
MRKKDFRRARKRVTVSVGESVRIIRELQGFSQSELARLTDMPQSTISAIERDRINLGVERAKILARVLRCHPAVLVFPGWDVKKQSAA